MIPPEQKKRAPLNRSAAPRHLAFLLDYAEAGGYTVTGGAMGNLVCSVREENGQLAGYFEVWLPIE